MSSTEHNQPANQSARGIFKGDMIDRMRAGGNVWSLPGGRLLLPEVFGFCRGVERALNMLQEVVCRRADSGGQIFLLGEIIHNPWVNEHFRRCGVLMLSPERAADLEQNVTARDCAVIPAFGVRPDIEKRLIAIGCEIIDTSCGDVRRLWKWAEWAAGGGYSILIFGRPAHDETVVTKSRLAAAGGRYLVVESIERTKVFADYISGRSGAETFADAFGPDVTNVDRLAPFERLAQVSQTTMLYDETMAVRDLLHSAFATRFGRGQLADRLLFHPTVCRATQDRQKAAGSLCRSECDLAVVVGGFGSSNTRHLYELASAYVPAVFIEGADAIRSEHEIETIDATFARPEVRRGWLPTDRPIRIAVLAGASCPEVVIGQVLERLAQFLS